MTDTEFEWIDSDYLEMTEVDEETMGGDGTGRSWR